MIKEEKEVQLLVEGGGASASKLGPALGPLGVNIGQVIAEINKKTAEYKGLTVPVRVIVNLKTRQFRVEVGTPPTSALIKREIGIKKGASDRKSSAGDIPLEKVINVAKIKMKDMLASNLKRATLEVLGTCVSMGVTVNGKDPREIQREIEEGKYDSVLK